MNDAPSVRSIADDGSGTASVAVADQVEGPCLTLVKMSESEVSVGKLESVAPLVPPVPSMIVSVVGSDPEMVNVEENGEKTLCSVVIV